MLSSNPIARVRKGRPSDAEVLATVFADSWYHTYRGIIPDPYLKRIADRRCAQWWRQAVRSKRKIASLDVGDALVGYAIYGSSRHTTKRGGRRGEIFELYLLPDHQGLGFGEYLFECCRNRLDTGNHDGLVTWALEDNTRAIDFYWRRGGRPFKEVSEVIGGRKLTRVCLSWP